MSDTRNDKVAGTARPVWGVPFATLAFLVMIVVIGAMVWPMQRFETAPGRAKLVAPRLSIEGASDGVGVFEPDRSVRFVTALGSELAPLQSFMGWIDPYVDVQTCEQRFGDCDPDANRTIQLGAMSTAKEIASFVALDYLGLDASFDMGPAQVGGFDPALCPDDAPELRACRVLSVGDTIVKVDLSVNDTGSVDDSIDIDVVTDLSKALADAEPGDVIRLVVRPFDAPADEVRTVKVELMASPDDPKRTIIGFNARDTRTVKLPFEIGIDTDEIGGPSAGLAFTVALIDELSPGELSPPGGVALTGTIAEDGSVGPIGALVQKAIAVQRSGARYFIVPAGQDPADVEAARRAVGTSVEIATVATLAEALATLERWGGEPVTRR
ncbi:MAG: S16 family serine protease [Actinomycetota bacterium]